MKTSTCFVGLVLLLGTSCRGPEQGSSNWRLSESAQHLVDEELAGQIFRALDAAERAGTDPPISRFHVRAATVVESQGQEHVIVGGNTEYQVPEAIHGETSLLNHVATRLGAEATRRVRFIAFYAVAMCGTSLGCGDCRDYAIATTDYQNLLVVCGQASDHTVQIRRFADAVFPEEAFPEVAPEEIPLPPTELERLVRAAGEAREGGITLFTSAKHHAGAAGLSWKGNLYRAAGADDAAFHYRYPIGGVLQQAATEGDYFIEAVVVVGEPGGWPWVSYRDRQYGYESSSFNRRRGLEPILLILTDGRGGFRMTTFEEALPHGFSTDAFMPDAVEEFLERHAEPSATR
jgi:cytidine deaminase